MGSPLLDICAVVRPDMLTKHKLKPNGSTLRQTERVFDELLQNYEVEYSAGGSAQNTIRVVQWILDVPKATCHTGCVGQDENGRLLEEVAREAGVNVFYQMDPKYPTGKCAVLITGISRSLVTKLDAAEHFSPDHIDRNWDIVENAKVYYSTGYFATTSVEAMLKVAKYAVEAEKVFSINLSAPFVCKHFSESLLKIYEYSELVFGNHTEVAAFSVMMGWSKDDNIDLPAVAQRMAGEMQFRGPKSHRGRTVVITQGPGPVIVAQSPDAKPKVFEVDTIDEKDIVDTDGAGDAFAGGYLAQLILGSDLETRVRCGAWAAGAVIQRSGCTLPLEMKFKK